MREGPNETSAACVRVDSVGPQSDGRTLNASSFSTFCGQNSRSAKAGAGSPRTGLNCLACSTRPRRVRGPLGRALVGTTSETLPANDVERAESPGIRYEALLSAVVASERDELELSKDDAASYSASDSAGGAGLADGRFRGSFGRLADVEPEEVLTGFTAAEVVFVVGGRLVGGFEMRRARIGAGAGAACEISKVAAATACVACGKEEEVVEPSLRAEAAGGLGVPVSGEKSRLVLTCGRSGTWSTLAVARGESITAGSDLTGVSGVMRTWVPTRRAEAGQRRRRGYRQAIWVGRTHRRRGGARDPQPRRLLLDRLRSEQRDEGSLQRRGAASILEGCRGEVDAPSRGRRRWALGPLLPAHPAARPRSCAAGPAGARCPARTGHCGR